MDYEDAEGYAPGGYHPVHLGDIFNNDRYVVDHKLEFGTYATAWLAHDLHQNQYVALELPIANEPSSSEGSKFLRLLSPQPELQKSGVWRRSSSNSAMSFPALLDEFMIHGPKGIHLCLQKSLDPALAECNAPSSGYHWQRLHESGIVHGDLHTGNILFRVPGVESWTREQVHTYLGKPLIVYCDSDSDSTSGNDSESGSGGNYQPDPSALNRPVSEYFVTTPPAEVMIPLCLDDCTIHSVSPAGFCHVIPGLIMARNYFGEAFLSRPQVVHKSLAAPVGVSAPEVLFEDVLTPASDILSLACLIFITISDYLMWDYFNGVDDVYIHFTITYGRLPEQWRTKWENRSEFFEKGGQLRQDMVGSILTDDMGLRTQVTKKLLVRGAPSWIWERMSWKIFQGLC